MRSCLELMLPGFTLANDALCAVDPGRPSDTDGLHGRFEMPRVPPCPLHNHSRGMSKCPQCIDLRKRKEYPASSVTSYNELNLMKHGLPDDYVGQHGATTGLTYSEFSVLSENDKRQRTACDASVCSSAASNPSSLVNASCRQNGMGSDTDRKHTNMTSPQVCSSFWKNSTKKHVPSSRCAHSRRYIAPAADVSTR